MTARLFEQEARVLGDQCSLMIDLLERHGVFFVLVLVFEWEFYTSTRMQVFCTL
jgi:hypothetical protein